MLTKTIKTSSGDVHVFLDNIEEEKRAWLDDFGTFEDIWAKAKDVREEEKIRQEHAQICANIIVAMHRAYGTKWGTGDGR